MSAYITLNTPMMDEESLIAALGEQGFTSEKVEIHEAPVPLVGYQGDLRAQQAEIVIRRRHVGASSNDIGFQKSATGYRAIISDYDQGSYGAGWRAQLNQHYQKHWGLKQARLAEEERQRIEEEKRRLVEAQRQAVHERAKKMGYRVQETQEAGKIRLVLVKRTY